MVAHKTVEKVTIVSMVVTAVAALLCFQHLAYVISESFKTSFKEEEEGW